MCYFPARFDSPGIDGLERIQTKKPGGTPTDSYLGEGIFVPLARLVKDIQTRFWVSSLTKMIAVNSPKRLEDTKILVANKIVNARRSP